ncbi:hypothetical protein FKM82_027295, partial [Ascaphus truei]
KQKELEEIERDRKREEKIRRKEEKQREREARRNKRKLEKIQAEEQKRLQEKIRFEERRILLAQRNLQSIRLIAELLSRVKAGTIREQEEKEAERIHLLMLEERRKEQEAELRRVEEEKERALGLQRKEKELREKLLNSLLNRNLSSIPQSNEDTRPLTCYPLKPSETIPQDAPFSYVTSTCTQTSRAQTPSDCEPPHSNYANSSLQGINGVCHEDSSLQECKPIKNKDHNLTRPLSMLTSNLGNSDQHNNSVSSDQNLCLKDSQAHQSNSDRERTGVDSKLSRTQDKIHKDKRKHKRDIGREDDGYKKVRRTHRKHSSKDHRRGVSPEQARHKRDNSRDVKDRHSHRQRSRHRKSYSRERESRSS